jgi:hydroxyacylglutathione hydrolase
MEVLKKILIAVGILAGIILVLYGVFVYKNKSEMGKFQPNGTKEIAADIYSIKDTFVNMYLVKSGSNYIAIDAANNLQNVKQELDKLNIEPEKVIAILFTHTDYDHVGALKLFKNAKAYISTTEEQMINGKTVRNAATMKNKLDSAYEMIADNQTLDISGLRVKGILTPGHTPGSMSYLINNEYLFTGDTLSLKNGKVELFNTWFNMDSDTEGKSITKLTTLSGIKDVFTAHYGYTDNFHNAMSSWKDKK